MNNEITLHRLLIFTIILTNLSQIPSLIDNGLGKYLSYIPWILMTGMVILIYNDKHLYIGKNKYLYRLTIVFLICCFTLSIIGRNGFGVYLLRPLLLSVFIYVVAYNLGWNLEQDKLENYLLAYVVSGVVVTTFVYKAMIGNGFSWSSKVYAYTSKNSVSQIILTAIILLVFLHGKKNKIFDIACDMATIALTISLLMLKSRASLLGIVVVVFSVLFSKKYEKSTKVLIWFVVIAFVIALGVNEEFRRFIVDSILFAGRDRSDINSISSGRVGMINEFPSLFWDKPILGYGQYYVESMPLDAFVETGLFGGLCINVIALSPVLYSLRAYKRYNKSFDYLLLIVSICYYTNGLFEQIAPFGPGVKCYFLWLLFGLSAAWGERDEYKYSLDN